MAKKVYILGAGYAGVEAALTLYKKKKKKDDTEIYVIDRNSHHTLFTLLHEVAGNRIEDEIAQVPLQNIFQYTDIKIIKDEIETIDFANKKLVSGSAEYIYDYLVISSGSGPDDCGVKGVKENGFTLWSVEDAKKLKNHVQDCFNRALTEKNKEKRKALLTFVIGGGGFTGVETAGELSLWTRQLCKEYGISRDEAKVVIVEAQQSILTNLSAPNLKKSRDYLVKKLGVQVLEGSAVVEAAPGAVKLASGTRILTQTLIWTAGMKGSNLAEKIDIEVGEDQRIKVDEFTNTQYENVFAAGNAALFNAGDYYLPKKVEFARQTGRRAAKNILADIRGKEKDILRPQLFGIAVSVGSFFAVSNFIGIRFPRFLSILIKYLMNVKYLFGIGGFELASRYLKAEIFYKKQKKFLLEEHYSKPTLAYWLVPIRLFLGYAWLMEGVAKVKEGWLENAMLAGRAADAGTSASVTETGEKVFRIVADHTPGWYAWIAETLIVPHGLLFQTLIVITEIGLGLAFISGTFTFLAGLIALGLNVNFLLSTGLLETTWWYIPAAICMLGGAGRAFGVDHYLIPYITRQWRYFIRNKRIKLWLIR